MCAYRDTRDADDWMATDRFFHSFKVADEDGRPPTPSRDAAAQRAARERRARARRANDAARATRGGGARRARRRRDADVFTPREGR